MSSVYQETCRRLQSAVQAAVTTVYVPTDLLSIVSGYAIDWTHSWPTEPVSDGLRFEADKLVCTDSFNWYRIASARSIANGPNRWRIQTTFFGQDHGWIAVGATVGSSAVRRIPSSGYEHWKDPASADDVLVRTSAAPAFVSDCQSPVMLMLDYQSYIRTVHSAATAAETTDYVEIDLPNRILIIRQTVGTKTIQIRQNLLPTQDIAVWRPCVVVTGHVSVVILPWNED